MEQQQEKPFHAIIGEHHFYQSSIKTAKRLLELLVDQGYKKIAVCFEHPASLPLLEYYKERVKLSEELFDMAFNKRQPYDVLLNHVMQTTQSSKPTNTLAFSLFGKDRIKGFLDMCEYCDSRKITFVGIDTQQFNHVSDLTARRKMRSNYMYHKTEEFDKNGISTLMVIGQGHLLDLYQESGGKDNYHFILIEDKKDFLKTSMHASLKSTYQQSLTSASGSSLDQATKNDMKGKSIFINENDVLIAENIIYSKLVNESIYNEFDMTQREELSDPPSFVTQLRQSLPTYSVSAYLRYPHIVDVVCKAKNEESFSDLIALFSPMIKRTKKDESKNEITIIAANIETNDFSSILKK